MAKKMRGVNTKVAAANERKAATKAAKDAKTKAENERKEAADWARGSNTRAKSRADALEQKRQQVDAKKAEIKRLMEEENKMLSKMKPAGSVQRKAQKKMVDRGAPLSGISVFKSTSQAPDTTNVKKQPLPMEKNRNRDDAVSASGIDAALDSLYIGSNAKDSLDRHPERRQKAAFKAYEERMLPIVKEDFPNLKLSQYKQKIFEMWKKAPENPRNQEHLAYNAKQ